MSTTAEVDLSQFRGHYEVVYSPDEDFYWVSLWWCPDDDSPHFLSPYAADDWARKQGGVTRHRT